MPLVCSAFHSGFFFTLSLRTIFPSSTDKIKALPCVLYSSPVVQSVHWVLFSGYSLILWKNSVLKL